MIDDAYYLQQNVTELQTMVQKLENRIEDLERARFQEEHEIQQQIIKFK